MSLLIALAVLAVLAGPVLAIMALAAVRRLEDGLEQSQKRDMRIQELTQRIYALEQQRKNQSSEQTRPEETTPPPAIRPVSPPADVPYQPQSQPAPPARSLPPAVATPAESLPMAAPQSVSGATPASVSAGSALRPIAEQARTSPADLESLIGGRWLNRIGIVALLIAISYFLKLAFDNNWIGEKGRVSIGILLGALMLPWSHWLLRRSYTYFSEGIAALGEATLFLSVWAGCQYYTLYSRDVGFAGMIAITVGMAAIAIGRDSQRIAVLSLIGGLLAPVLASSGQDQQVVLFTYLLFLGAGTLAIAAKKEWSALAPIAFIGTQVYFWGWYSDFFHRTAPTERTVLFACLFFLWYSALPVRRAMRGASLGNTNIIVVLLNEFALAGALFALLWPDDKWPLTLFFVALAAAHVAVARWIPTTEKDQGAIAQLLFAGLALTYLTLAIPVRVEGKWITLGFAVEGAVLVWAGFRSLSSFLRQSGYLLLAISALRLLFWPPPGGSLLFNERFAAYAVFIACLAMALWSARSHPDQVAGQERMEIGIFGVAINIYALIALSAECWDYFGKQATGMDAALAQHLALSVLWTVYATALVVFGAQVKSALLRWQGLALFGVVVGKVFLYDLSFLDRAYRILSFFVLGAVLLAVSFLYQRKLARERVQ